MKSKFLMAAAVALVTSTSGGLAKATTFVDFTISGAGDPTATFTLPISPTPFSFVAGFAFTITNVQVSFNGNPPVVDGWVFFNSSNGGGLQDGLLTYDILGAQYYSGPESSPTFIPGVYTGQGNDANGTVDTITITEVSATTPLPGALPLFATGLGGLGLLGWRRKRKTI